MNEINVNEIVRIETLPKVFSQLEKIGSYIDEHINGIEELEWTEENKQEVINPLMIAICSFVASNEADAEPTIFLSHSESRLSTFELKQ